MNYTDTRIAQLEDEIRKLKAQLRESRFFPNVLNTPFEYWKSENTIRSIFNYSADGIVLMDSNGTVLEWSKGYEHISGLDEETVVGKFIWEVAAMLFNADTQPVEELQKLEEELKSVVCNMEQKAITRHVKHYKTGEHKVFNVLYFPVSMPRGMMLGGISRDVTEEIRSYELHEEHERNLEITVKERTEELSVTNEELIASNEELYAINDELNTVNTQLEKYRTKLEMMVDEKTEEVVAQQKRLEEISSRQEILIKVLNIVQSADNLLEALDVSIAEIGEYAGVSHVYIFEKTIDGNAVSCTHEWCNPGLTPTYDRLQNMPIKPFEPWFDIFDAGGVINAPEIVSLNPDAADLLASFGVKSTIILPLTTTGVSYGFVVFDECNTIRKWEQNEVELLKSLSQIVTSTTHRHRAEEAIRLSQQTMHTILDNITANIFVVEFETMKILFANESIKKLVGKEIEGQICWQVLHKGRNDICDTCPKKYFNSKSRYMGVYHWEQYNDFYGRCYANDVTAFEWVDGRLVQMEVATDITDRKRAEEAMRQSEAMYRQLTVASPDAIVVCGPDGHVRYVSPKALEVFGLKDDTEIINRRMARFVHPHDHRHSIKLFRKLWNDNIHFIPQLLMLRSDDTEFIGEISAATVKDAKNQTASIIMVIRDITRRKVDEMELIHAKEKAEESDKLKSAFLANISHEIRTPINGIVGFLQFLASDDLPPDSKQDYVNEINNSCTRLVQQIEDIIDVAKIEANQMNISPVLVSVNDLMYEMYTYFDNYLQTGSINKSLNLFFDNNNFPDRCVIYTDPLRLRQVLTNLLDNAIKFTQKGYIRFGYRQSAPDQLEFVVEDTGIGLSPDFHEVIFNSFRQAELSNSRLYGGNGLGLTISRGLVQIMGGDMRIESTEGKGSIFYFTISYLPVTAEDRRFFDGQQDTPSDVKPFADKLVLVVEPVIMKYMYYEKLLAAAGFTVQHAENVHQWLNFISQTNRIDAVMVDASVFDHAYEVEISQIKSIRTGLPMFMFGVKQNMKHVQIFSASPNYMELEEPVNYEKIVEAMQGLVK